MDDPPVDGVNVMSLQVSPDGKEMVPAPPDWEKVTNSPAIDSVYPVTVAPQGVEPTLMSGSVHPTDVVVEVTEAA
jgi:hypothetical protein